MERSFSQSANRCSRANCVQGASHTDDAVPFGREKLPLAGVQGSGHVCLQIRRHRKRAVTAFDKSCLVSFLERDATSP